MGVIMLFSSSACTASAPDQELQAGYMAFSLSADQPVRPSSPFRSPSACNCRVAYW